MKHICCRYICLRFPRSLAIRIASGFENEAFSVDVSTKLFRDFVSPLRERIKALRVVSHWVKALRNAGVGGLGPIARHCGWPFIGASKRRFRSRVRAALRVGVDLRIHLVGRLVSLLGTPSLVSNRIWM